MTNFRVQEAVKVLRTNLQFCGQSTRVIAITSTHENEGKTVVALHIAKSFAELGKNVLVVDADMRKSVIAGRNTDSTDYTGLSEVLNGLKKVSECIKATTVPHLFLLLAGKYPPNPVELLSGQFFASLITEARKVYDYIIIDTPPLGAVIDAAVVASNCDGIALVIGDDSISSRVVKGVVDQLKLSDCRILGVIRNNARGSKRDGYYGKYGRYGKYGKYYGKYYGKQPQAEGAKKAEEAKQ